MNNDVIVHHIGTRGHESIYFHHPNNDHQNTEKFPFYAKHTFQDHQFT